MIIEKFVTRPMAIVVSLTLLVPGHSLPVSGEQAAGTPTSAVAEPDGGWPRLLTLAGGSTLLMYQPQVATWDKQTRIVAFSAVSYQQSGKTAVEVGTIKLEADTKVSVAERLVRLHPINIVQANFPTLDRDGVRTLTAEIEKAIPDDERVIALDRILANLDKSQVVVSNKEGVKAEAPPIFFSRAPAGVVIFDGEPIWSPIRDNDLKFAVNTNWDVFEHAPTKTFYLRHEASWLSAASVNGPWAAAGTLPESFKKLPADENWKDVRANLPGKKLSASTTPAIFVSFRPAELIVITGASPAYRPVAGTNLQWVSNTESDVFRVGTAGPIYYLVAGRWFSASDFHGPWTFATPSLPADFAKIPLEHERSRVLASVPGTDQAVEAVLLAQIPQTARVKKNEIKAPEVSIQGNPELTRETAAVERVVNTDKDIFKVGNRYYMCYQGVWFVGSAANGPWEVAETVPQEIYAIPMSSPAHHVTYVTVEDDDDDEWVTFAAAAGYTGMMIAWGCVVWGSGWYYPPYVGWGGYYPHYYPHFPTYGYSAWYNPWTGAYGRSAGVYGPYGGAGVGARYNPRTGTYSRGAAAYGPYGSRAVASAYNPRTGTYATTRQGSNVYGSWGSTSVQRGDDWARTNRYTNRQTGTTTRTVRTDEGSAVSRRGPDGGMVAAGDGGNIYAGRDGNAYRRQDGTWQKYDNGGWSDTDRQPGNTPRPTERATSNTTRTTGVGVGTGTVDRSTIDRGTMDQLNRDSAARSEGVQRTRDAGSYRGGSGAGTRTGSYRGGGGGAPRGGGGGRRR